MSFCTPLSIGLLLDPGIQTSDTSKMICTRFPLNFAPTRIDHSVFHTNRTVSAASACQEPWGDAMVCNARRLLAAQSPADKRGNIAHLQARMPNKCHSLAIPSYHCLLQHTTRQTHDKDAETRRLAWHLARRHVCPTCVAKQQLVSKALPAK